MSISKNSCRWTGLGISCGLMVVALAGCDQRSPAPSTPTSPTTPSTQTTSQSESEATASPDKAIAVAENRTPPAATAPETSGLKKIDYTLITNPLGLTVHITVSPTGSLYAVHVIPPNPGGLKVPKQDDQSGQLTAAQIAELQTLFADWDSLTPNYPRFPDGPDIQIQYGGKKVNTGGQPQVIRDIQKKLEEFAKPMEHITEK